MFSFLPSQGAPLGTGGHAASPFVMTSNGAQTGLAADTEASEPACDRDATYYILHRSGLTSAQDVVLVALEPSETHPHGADEAWEPFVVAAYRVFPPLTDTHDGRLYDAESLTRNIGNGAYDQSVRERVSPHLAPYVQGLSALLEPLGSPFVVVDAPEMDPFRNVMPVAADTVPGVLRVYLDLPVIEEGLEGVPGAVIGVIDALPQDRLVLDDDSVYRGGVINECRLIDSVRAILGQRTARAARPVADGLDSNYASNEITQPFSLWQRTCSASSIDDDDDVPALRQAAAAFGLDVPDDHITNPALLCADMASPAVSRAASVLGAGQAPAAWASTWAEAAQPDSETHARIQEALDDIYVTADNPIDALYEDWSALCFQGPDALVFPQEIDGLLDILHPEWGIDADQLVERSIELAEAGEARLRVPIGVVQNNIEGPFEVAIAAGLKPTVDDLLYPGRLCGVLASIVFDTGLTPPESPAFFTSPGLVAL